MYTHVYIHIHIYVFVYIYMYMYIYICKYVMSIKANGTQASSKAAGRMSYVATRHWWTVLVLGHWWTAVVIVNSVNLASPLRLPVCRWV